MHDVIVVGARCAGAPTAMLLARQGYKVLLVDRSTFPSDIPHGHFIHRHGPRRLASWGLLDRIVATNCPAVTSTVLDLGDFPLAATGLVVDGIALGYGPRRSVLDHALVTAAVEAGAELRTGITVDDFIVDGDRVTGIRGKTSGGGRIAESAAVVVGADGRRSRLARFVAAPEYERAPTAACWYFFVLERRANDRRRDLLPPRRRGVRVSDQRRTDRDLRRMADRTATDGEGRHRRSLHGGD